MQARLLSYGRQDSISPGQECLLKKYSAFCSTSGTVRMVFFSRDPIRRGSEHDWLGITAVTKLATHRFAREQIEKEPLFVCRRHRFISKAPRHFVHRSTLISTADTIVCNAFSYEIAWFRNLFTTFSMLQGLLTVTGQVCHDVSLYSTICASHLTLRVARLGNSGYSDNSCRTGLHGGDEQIEQPGI